MLLYLIKALETTNLMEVVENLSLPLLDIELMLYEAEENGDVEIDRKNKKIKALRESEVPCYNPDLAAKLVKLIKRHEQQESNIIYDELKRVSLVGPYGYQTHDFVCTLYALEQGEIAMYEPLNKYEISVPELKNKRPYRKFVFYTFLDHQEFGAKAVNKFIDQWAKTKVK